MIALLAILISVVILCLAVFAAWKISSNKCKQCTDHAKCKFHTLTREHERLDTLNKKFRSKQCAEGSQMKKNIKELTTRIGEIQGQLQGLTAAATPDRAIAGEVDYLTAKLAGAQAAPDANAEKIASIEAQLAAATGALEASTANATKIASIEAQLAAARGAPDANATKIAEMESELVAARGAIHAATVNAAKIEALEAQLVATRGELSAASAADLDRSNTLVDAMQKSQRNVMDEVVARDKIAIDKIAAIEATLAAALAAPDANATKIAAIQEQLTSAIQTAVRNLGSVIGADRDKIAAIEKQLATANGRIDADLLNMAAIEKELAAARGAPEANATKIAAIEEKLGAARVELSAVSATNATKITDIQAQLTAARGFASLDATGLKVAQIKAHPQSFDAKMPNGWGGGIHSWDVYANATIAAGKDGSVAAYMNSSGDIMGSGKLTMGANPINLTSVWSESPDGTTNVAEISNDVGVLKKLMIVGNKSAGGNRKVGVMDELQVHGDLKVDKQFCINSTCITEDLLKNMIKPPFFRIVATANTPNNLLATQGPVFIKENNLAVDEGDIKGWNANTLKYTIPVTGNWLITTNVRMLRDALDTRGVTIQGIPNNNSIWVPTDGSSRRSANITRMVYLTKGTDIWVTHWGYDGQTTNGIFTGAVFEGTFIGNK